MAREPGGEVENDPGKETGFSDANQKTQQVEAHGRFDKHHGCRQQAPSHHDPGNPAPGAEFVQRDIAGDLEHQVTDEEHPGPQPVDRFTELQVIEHLQLGEADIDPVQISDQVTDHQQRNDPPRGFTVGRMQCVVRHVTGERR